MSGIGPVAPHEYTAQVAWTRGEQPFLDNRYSRRHRVRFDSGVEVPGASSPLVVAVPMSDPSAVDPEELFVASLASCHMLWFLSIAAARGFRVDAYTDDAVAVMETGARGKQVISVVTLRPVVTFSGARLPDAAAYAHMHERAHAECFIANSVRSEVRCEPRMQAAPGAG